MPRSLRGSSAIWFALVVLLAVLVPASGVGSASPGGAQRVDTVADQGINPSPNLSSSRPPGDCITNVSSTQISFSAPFGGGHDDPACGSSKNDQMHVTDDGGAGTQIWGGPGADVINAKNKKIDEIWGDGGDSATIDWCLPNGKIHDTIHGVQLRHVKKAKVKCTDVKPQARHTAAATDKYPFEEPLIDCTATAAGTFRVAVAHEPVIRAVDATPNVDWQTVSFSAVLYEWNATESTWDLKEQSPWFWDRAPDDQLEDFQTNLWRPFDKSVPRNIFFTPKESGRYHVSIDYHWYAATGVKKYDTGAVPATLHFDHFASPNLGECDFPGTPPPDGKYTGKTDDGNDISFLTEAIWPSATRAVGGTRLTTVQIRSSVSCTPPGITSYGIAFVPTRWIQLNYDNTFAYAASSPISSATSTSGRTNVTATYSITGKVDLATATGTAVATWTGTVAIWQLSFDLNGTHYSCTGKPHVWTAKLTS